MAAKKTTGSKKKKLIKKPASKRRKLALASEKAPPPPEVVEQFSEGDEEYSSDFSSGAGIPTPQSIESPHEKALAARKASERQEYRRRVEEIFDTHKKLCGEASSVLESIRSLSSRMAELDRTMKGPDFRRLYLAKDLKFDALFNDIQVASRRLGRICLVSSILNTARRDPIFNEIESEGSPFE